MHTRVVGQLLLTLVLLPRAAFSQAPAPIPSSAGGALAARKQARALAVDDGAIELDGRLSEEVWLKATAITDFTQKEPVEGGAPTDAMDVRFVYDDTALYVGARMTARVERTIQAPLGLRDTSDQAEHILVSLDTFLDRRTAAVFGVTAAGVRLDRFHATDNEDSFDGGFDPVWEAKTTVDDDGWTAELWIPFSQLRFNPRAEQVWGLNVQRFRPTLDEEDYWIVIPRTERAWASRFGELRGIDSVQPSRRIELLPYVAGSSAITPASGDAQPVRRRRQPRVAGGRRPEDGPGPEPHARGDVQSRLRPGRGRSCRSQPDGVRDAVYGEAAVLPRRRVALQPRPSRTSITRGASARARSARRPATTSTIRRPARSSARPSSPDGCRRRPRSVSCPR